MNDSNKYINLSNIFIGIGASLLIAVSMSEVKCIWLFIAQLLFVIIALFFFARTIKISSEKIKKDDMVINANLLSVLVKLVNEDKNEDEDNDKEEIKRVYYGEYKKQLRILKDNSTSKKITRCLWGGICFMTFSITLVFLEKNTTVFKNDLSETNHVEKDSDAKYRDLIHCDTIKNDSLIYKVEIEQGAPNNDSLGTHIKRQ
jgi:hypothetical protein